MSGRQQVLARSTSSSVNFSGQQGFSPNALPAVALSDAAMEPYADLSASSKSGSRSGKLGSRPAAQSFSLGQQAPGALGAASFQSAASLEVDDWKIRHMLIDHLRLAVHASYSKPSISLRLRPFPSSSWSKKLYSFLRHLFAFLLCRCLCSPRSQSASAWVLTNDVSRGGTNV